MPGRLLKSAHRRHVSEDSGIFPGETKYQTPGDVARKLARRVAVKAHPLIRDVIHRQIAQSKHGGFVGIIWLQHEDGEFTVDVQVGAP